jgi:hypothetical protein
MTLTARRPPPFVTMLAAPLLALAAGSLVLAVPTDLAWGQGHSSPHQGAAVVVNAEILVLHGTQVEGRGSIDPAIGHLPQLRQPPLSAYNSYRLLDRRTLTLETGRSGTYTLANGRVLQVTVVEPTSDHGFHVKAAINQPGGNAYLKLLELTAKPNEPFFVAGQPFQGGNIILAITLRR